MVPYGKTAVVEYEGTFDDGSVFSSTKDIDPLEFVVGEGTVIHGFDEAVHDMQVGEQRAICVEPKDAFGEYDESRVEFGPMYAIPNAKDIEIGKTFYFITPEGLKFPARVTEVNGGIARVDFNHPFAGKNLNFTIRLVAVRD